MTPGGLILSTTMPMLSGSGRCGEWGMCGGVYHDGPTECCGAEAASVRCYAQSEWYSQCRTDCPAGWACGAGEIPRTEVGEWGLEHAGSQAQESESGGGASGVSEPVLYAVGGSAFAIGLLAGSFSVATCWMVLRARRAKTNAAAADDVEAGARRISQGCSLPPSPPDSFVTGTAKPAAVAPPPCGFSRASFRDSRHDLCVSL